jgi:hypothetical protein
MKTFLDYQTLVETHVKSPRQAQVQALVKRLDKSGFFKSPASSAPTKHLAVPGGLAQHSWHVIHTMMKLADALFTTTELSFTEPPAPSATNKLDLYESCVIVGICHDLNKANIFGSDLYVPNILKDKTQSVAKPYEKCDRPAIGGNVESIMLASRYIDLKPDEVQAIAWCEGLYNRQYMVDIAGKEFFLTIIAHAADMIAAHIVENHVPLSRPTLNFGDHEAVFGVASLTVPRANGAPVEAMQVS